MGEDTPCVSCAKRRGEEIKRGREPTDPGGIPDAGLPPKACLHLSLTDFRKDLGHPSGVNAGVEAAQHTFPGSSTKLLAQPVPI